MPLPGGRRSGYEGDIEREGGVWSAARRSCQLAGAPVAEDLWGGADASTSRPDREMARGGLVRAGRRARGGAWLALWVCLAAAALPRGSGACTEWETEVDQKRCTNGVVAATYDTNDEEPPNPTPERSRAP